MTQTTVFTAEEITFVANVFARQTINPMAPNGHDIIDLVQGIVKKMEALKEAKDGEQPTER